MSKLENTPFSNPKGLHIGLVVKDLDKAKEYYTSLGIGPFRSYRLQVTEKEMFGKPVAPGQSKVRSANAKWGPVDLSLFQLVEGPNVSREFLEKYGEGINHIDILVDDLDGDMKKLIKKGLKVITSGKYAGGGGWAYFDTREVGNVILCLEQLPPEY